MAAGSELRASRRRTEFDAAGRGVEEALRVTDAQYLQMPRAFRRLDRLRDRFHAYGPADALNGSHRGKCHGVFQQIDDQAGVEFHEIDAQPLEQIEGHLALAEVIDGDAAAT